jgi:hypothetical protein
MKSMLLLIILALGTIGAFWFVWMNRASEKIVTSTVPIAILALIGIFFVGWVFGGEDDYQVVFPVCFPVDLRTKLVIEEPMIFRNHRFYFGPSQIAELRKQRPDLFPDDKNNFVRNVYQHFLQRSFVDFLVMLYRGTWRGRALRFDIGLGGIGQYGPAPEPPQASHILKASDIEQALAGNWFARIPAWPDPQLALPPGSELSITPPAGGGDSNSNSEMRIRNDFCTITVTVESDFPMRSVGEYRIMAGLSDQAVRDFATELYIVRARIHYSRLRSGHPRMKLYKEWAKQLVHELQNQFDEQRIWSQVKEEYMRMRHYPPETLTPSGRFPQQPPH